MRLQIVLKITFSFVVILSFLSCGNDPSANNPDDPANSAKKAPMIVFAKAYGGVSAEEAYAVQQTNDGGSIIAGVTWSSDGDITENKGINDCWIIKLSSSGSLEWQKTFGGSNYEEARSVQQTKDGGYIIAGYTTSNDGDVSGRKGDRDVWVLKLTNSGNLEWQKTLGGQVQDEANSIQQTNDGGYIFAGYTQTRGGDVSSSKGGGDYWIVKLTSSGSIEWEKTLGGDSFDEAKAIQQTSDGGYIVVGNSSSNNIDVSEKIGRQDIWVVKLSNTGSIIWQKSLGGSDIDEAGSVQQTKDGGYIVVGSRATFNISPKADIGDHDYLIVKLTSSGNFVWQKVLGGGKADVAKSVRQVSDGGYVIAGYTKSSNGNITSYKGGDADCWIIKLASTGELLWQKTLGGAGEEKANSIDLTNDGGYILAGKAGGNSGDVIGTKSSVDFWVVKLKP